MPVLLVATPQRLSGRDLGGGITGLQWVVDGCTLMGPSRPAPTASPLAQPASFMAGLRTSLPLAAGVALVAAAASRLLRPPRGSHDPEVAPA